MRRETARIEVEEESEEEGSERAEMEFQWMELSLCSARGLTQPQTMKMEGVIQGRKVLVLIDSGASHNFISTRLIQELRLGVDPTFGSVGEIRGVHLWTTSHHIRRPNTTL